MGSSLVKSNKKLVVVQLGLSWIPTITIMSFYLWYSIDYTSWFFWDFFFLASFFFFCLWCYMHGGVTLFFANICMCDVLSGVLCSPLMCSRLCLCCYLQWWFPLFCLCFCSWCCFFWCFPLVLLFNTTCNAASYSFVFAFSNVSMYTNLRKSWNMRHKVSWPYNDY
jgi:hypothetical protein